MVLHTTILGTTGYFAFVSQPGSNLFSWHPFLMTLAMVGLLNEALLVVSLRWTLLPRSLFVKWRIYFHGYLEAGAFTATAIGFWAIYNNKELLAKPHFATWHGLVGLIVTFAFGLQVLTGTLVKYWNGLDTPTMRTFHVVVGVATALGVLFSLVSGCQSNYFASKHETWSRNAITALVVLLNSFTTGRAAFTNGRIAALIKRLS